MTNILRTAILFVLVLIGFSVTPSWAADPYYGYERVVIQSATWTAPDYINLRDFPPLGGKLTERDARILDLHQEPLKVGGWFVNELRERHTFEVVYLERGTMVWADNAAGNTPRYLVSCGNRINFLLSHEITQVLNPAPPAPVPAPKARMRALWSWVWSWMQWPFVRYE